VATVGKLAGASQESVCQIALAGLEVSTSILTKHLRTEKLPYLSFKFHYQPFESILIVIYI
jgi:hypothetical protein